jgi:hypothetical protein
MSEVVINGIVYVPRVEIPTLTDERLKNALEELVSIQYFKQQHKAIPQAWNVLHALAPELAELAANDPEAAFRRLHPIEPYELSEAMSKFSAVKQIIKASNKAATLLQAALETSPDAEWLTLNHEAAKEAYEDLGLAKSNLEIFAVEVPELKNRLWNILEYSHASICLEPNGEARSHAGRSRSSVSQLNRVEKIIDDLDVNA